MHKLLVIHLVKLAEEKVWLGELCLNMAIAVDWEVKPKAKQNYSTSGDKNSTRPLVITSSCSTSVQDKCFRKNYLRKSYYILLTYVLHCIHF